MEIPSAEHIVFEAVNWLIGLDNVIEAEIIQKASDCERCLERAAPIL
jgi:hypothetical protein